MWDIKSNNSSHLFCVNELFVNFILNLFNCYMPNYIKSQLLSSQIVKLTF